MVSQCAVPLKQTGLRVLLRDQTYTAKQSMISLSSLITESPQLNSLGLSTMKMAAMSG